MKIIKKEGKLFNTYYVENSDITTLNKDGELVPDTSIDRVEYTPLGRSLLLGGTIIGIALLVITLIAVI